MRASRWLKRATKPGRKKRDFPIVFQKSTALVNDVLMDGRLHENMAASPLSFQVVLSLLAAGSQGSSRREFLKLFKASSRDHLNTTASLVSHVLLTDRGPADGPHMRCSTALWLDQSLTLKSSFKHVLDSHYRAAVNPVDFHTQTPSVRQQINSRVESETSGRVKDLIGEKTLNDKAKLVFTNVLYFKGKWVNKCDAKNLLPEHCDSKDLVVADFMTVKGKQFGKGYRGWQMQNQQFKLPSNDERFVSMSFCNPHTEFTHLTENLMDVNGNMVPKFTVSSETEASNVLRRRGISSAFSGGGLTGMLTSLDGQELYVSNIFQKAFIDINEQGTQAAAATAAIVMSGCPPCLPPVTPITRDGYYPFLFTTRNKDGYYLIGRSHLMISQLIYPFGPPPNLLYWGTVFC